MRFAITGFLRRKHESRMGVLGVLFHFIKHESRMGVLGVLFHFIKHES
jgi:hypothetical protein